MKINTSITSYDIKNLSAIVDKVSIIKSECSKLKYFADDMAKKANVDKEFNELLESVSEFTKKIKHAWRQW